MKNKFIKQAFILIIGGFLTKVISMIIKIVMARSLGTSGMGLYMLIMPTFTLFMALAQLGLPASISKLVSEKKYSSKRIIFSILPVILLFNLFLFILIFISAKFISNNLLSETRCYLSILSIAFVLPFISISSILRGYFFGKEKVIPHVISNVVEDIVRLLILLIGIPIVLQKGLSIAISFVVISNIFSEISSIIILILFLPKKNISKKDLLPNKSYIKNILNISIPTTGSRLIGSVGYFFEPIILTFILVKLGVNQNYIVNEYGIISGFVMPLLLLPSFFTMAITQALIPTISYNYSRGNLKETKKKIILAIIFSLLIGLPITLVFMFFPDFCLNLLYHNNSGSLYTRVLAPICLFLYIQAPLTGSLQAMGKASCAMKGTLYGMILRVFILILFCLLNTNLWALIIAHSVNMIFVTLYQSKYVISYLK